MNRSLLFILLLFCALSVHSQSEGAFPTMQMSDFEKTQPYFCWYNNTVLSQFREWIPLEKNLIVIARLGESDVKANLNKRRLHNIRAFLRREEPSLILAEGERVEGFGRVEFYLDGRLIEILKAFPNADLGVADCYGGSADEPYCKTDYQKSFYPCRDKTTTKKTRRRIAQKKVMRP